MANHNPEPALVNVSSGSLAFPAPSTTLAPFQGRVLEVFLSLTRHDAWDSNRLSDAPNLRFYFEAYGTKPSAEALCLSWDSSGFAPPPTLSLRPLPASEDAFGPALQHAGSCSALVDSHHLDGLLRNGAAGLLRPAAGHGVRSVSCSCAPTASRS